EFSVMGSDVSALGTTGISGGSGDVALTTTLHGIAFFGWANSTVTTAGTVALNAPGPIFQTVGSGAITANTLTGSSVGGLALNSANAISNLGQFDNTGSGDIQLTNAQALTVSGNVNAAQGDFGNITLKTTS